MHANEETIKRLYSAFAQLDAPAMEQCYAEDATFDDEVFSLRGKREVAGMWRMLCEATRDKGRDVWQLTWSDVTSGGREGSAHWEAHYRFSATGRMVHNRIDSDFIFTGQNLILTQHDRFNFWSWSRQALGVPGLLLGCTPFLRAKVRAQARASLGRFLGGARARA
jgi:hypothetical protein